ncbi:DUF2169 domain-containing protein [Pseudenhygromyxa sp. WMMC2535]|uniref:DUF2169 family type VI secretion system accessory protein n=1 Tax=Pseudenhygromyxa sp. WMMC2535 TaxID=2712867 RepID=UPI001552C038|nr:DUF2169 domain-containing protein [Pseudenhygromyxa sp. WMMC2535]NVB42850.1 DUF2169 domain-containing protein [Pseudenhygromyxa sp. WMMC2535]
MLQVENHTPFAMSLAPLPGRDGRETLFVMIRASFALNRAGVGEPSDEQPEPELVDRYRGEDGASSLLCASDLHPGKRGTDVVLMGSAWARGGVPTQMVDTCVRVAERAKVVRVYGDRSWRPGAVGPRPSPPEPFVSMPLIWERAYGGRGPTDPRTERYTVEARNPVGRGFAKGRPNAELHVEPVPNLVDPRVPFERFGQDALPACYAFIAPHWQPRAALAGTYDAAWQRRRAPYLPEDCDPGFFNAADPQLRFDRFLLGDEPVELHGLTPEGTLNFALPRLDWKIEVKHGRRWRLDCALAADLETVLFEPDLGRVSLSFRAAHPCDKHLLDIRKVKVDLQSTDEN